MDDRKSELIQEIKAAFRGVTLGNGTSIADAMVIDGCPDGEIESVSDLDTGSDWSEVPDSLIENYPVITFMDARGFRYYLPAYLLWTVRHYHERPGSSSPDSAVRCLTSGICCKPERRDLTRYRLLTRAQRMAIAHFLEFLCNEAWDQFSSKPIRRAVREYWLDCS